MNFSSLKIQVRELKKFLLTAIMLVLFLSCENRIIERSASEYFPLKTGCWWRYANDDLYDPMIIDISVENSDTILLRECYPFNVSGVFHYYSKDPEGIKEYVKLTQYYSGSEYIILQGFVMKLELPLVKGNKFVDSLVDSLEFFGQWIKARYTVTGLVADYETDDIYGEVYRVITSIHRSIISPDSTVVNEEYAEEYYAPGIGLVGFNNPNGSFDLTEFQLE